MKKILTTAASILLACAANSQHLNFLGVSWDMVKTDASTTSGLAADWMADLSSQVEGLGAQCAPMDTTTALDGTTIKSQQCGGLMIVDNPQLSVSVLTFHCSLQGHCGVNASAYHDLLNTQLPSHALVDDGTNDNKTWRNQVEAVRVLSENGAYMGMQIVRPYGISSN